MPVPHLTKVTAARGPAPAAVPLSDPSTRRVTIVRGRTRPATIPPVVITRHRGQQYPQSPYPGQGVANRTNTMAILSLVFAFVFFPLGIVFGFVARSQIKRTGEEGSGLALAGIIVGFAATAILVAYLVVVAVFFSAVMGGIKDFSPTPRPRATF